MNRATLKIISINITVLLDKEYICITTNGTVGKKSGKLNMGKGNAKLISSIKPWIAEKLGSLVSEHGNIPFYLGDKIFSFPVEDSWLSQANLNLVKNSAKLILPLIDKMDIQTVYLPIPGAGGGGLKEEFVIDALSEILDERFVLIRRID